MPSKTIAQRLREIRSRQADLLISGLRATVKHKKRQRVELARMRDSYGRKLSAGAMDRRQSEVEDIDLEIIEIESQIQKLEDENPH